MFKTLTRSAGYALSAVTALTMAIPIHAEVGFPDQCWPYCDYIYAFNMECVYWFGAGWYYCGYSYPWVYCCN